MFININSRLSDKNKSKSKKRKSSNKNNSSSSGLDSNNNNNKSKKRNSGNKNNSSSSGLDTNNNINNSKKRNSNNKNELSGGGKRNRNSHHKNINTMNNLEKYKLMISLLGKDNVKLSNFLNPWWMNRDMPEKKVVKGYMVWEPEGNYFEFLRWLAFKIVKDKNKTYLNKSTTNLLMFLEEQSITGIFIVAEAEEGEKGGLLYNLLKDKNEFKHTPDIITLSNTQLVFAINNMPENNFNETKNNNPVVNENLNEIPNKKKTRHFKKC